MKILKEGCPSKDGFHMPAEYEPHKGTILIWPKRPGSWIYGAKKAREAFADVICAAAESETVYLLVEAGELDHAQMIIEAVRKEKNYQKNYPVHYMEIASDDAWARDVGPTFVVNGQGQVRGIDWCFNAWGGICDGLYADWEKDDKVASSFCRKTEYDLYDAHPFVLEGGWRGNQPCDRKLSAQQRQESGTFKRKDRTEVKGLSWGRKNHLDSIWNLQR